MRRLIPVALICLLAGCTVEEESPTIPGGLPDPSPAARSTATEKSQTPMLVASESADDLVAQAQGAEQSADLTAAQRLLDRALKLDPKHRKALVMAARIAGLFGEQSPPPHNARQFLTAAKLMRTLQTTYPDLDAAEKQALAGALFNEACAYALTGETARVVPTLSEAHAAGFDDLAQLDLDPDLDPLRKDPAFQALLSRMEQEHAARVLEGNTPFPFDFKLPDPDGKTVSLADYKGKVLIVDFWGTWCPPCRKEIPHFLTLLKKYEKDGLAVVGLTYEQAVGDKANEAVRSFVNAARIPYRCLMVDPPTMKLVPNFQSFPTTLILDRAGKVRACLNGYQPLGALEAVVKIALAPKSEPKP